MQHPTGALALSVTPSFAMVRRIFLVGLLALAPIQASAGPAEEVNAFFARWKTAYDANDNVAVAKLYATDEVLHGTRSKDLTEGREAITKYFTVDTGNTQWRWQQTQTWPLLW